MSDDPNSELLELLRRLADSQSEQNQRLGRLEIQMEQATRPGYDLANLLGALEDAVGKVRLGMGEVRGDCARHRQDLCSRLESLESTLGEQRLSLGKLAAAGPASGDRILDDEADLLNQRLEAVEALLVHLGGAAPAAKPAGVEQELALELLERLEAVEALLVSRRARTPEQEEDAIRRARGRDLDQLLEGIEATLAEVRQDLGRVASGAEDGALETAMELRHRVEALEGLLGEQDLRLRRVLDGQSQRDLHLTEQLDALEANTADQRHALQRMVTTFDANAYSQRLEFQRRLADLMNNLVDQRQELHGQLAAIEAGFSDQRLTLTRLASAMARDDSAAGSHDPRVTVPRERPAGAGAQALPDQPPTPSGLHPAVSSLEREAAVAIEEKLGAVLDCLLADHVAGLARAGVDAGDLEESAYQELLRGLDELKLERLRGHHLGDDLTGQQGNGEEDAG